MNFCVVLVRPRDPNNIGACARAMANFGLSDLRVVNPFAPVWREATSAVGANDILTSARVCFTLEEALADSIFSFAATALRNRVLTQEIISLPSLQERLQTVPAGCTAFVFGNEKTGLSNEDIEKCSAVLNIPTASKQPSINLAQSVILTCYELMRSCGRNKAAVQAVPTHAQTEICLDVLDALFEKVDYKTDFTSVQRKALLRQILTRSGLNRNQLFFMKSFAEKISQKIGNSNEYTNQWKIK
ncbi:MAG: RNA methyltransferase [Elusimicrobiaceae bacterium]|nr:RNA methyltransferase [Elusimicrobiaceae bacterium]